MPSRTSFARANSSALFPPSKRAANMACGRLPDIAVGWTAAARGLVSTRSRKRRRPRPNNPLSRRCRLTPLFSKIRGARRNNPFLRLRCPNRVLAGSKSSPPKLSSAKFSKPRTKSKASKLKSFDSQVSIFNLRRARLTVFSLRPSLMLGCWILVLFESGCVSKKKANAEAHAAFMAGQQQAMVARGPQPASSVVTVVGPVHTPSLTWTQDLTLAKAIVDAGYESAVDPKQIMIVRNGQAVPVDPKSLLAGEDVPLLPGDMVVLRQ